MKMEIQMNVEVVAVLENRGIRKERGTLVVVPDSLSYLVELKLDDGRTAYLTGAGRAPFEQGKTLDITAR
jgi:hypothetical protein